MDARAWTGRLFRAIDARDADAFAGFLAEDAVFVLADAAPVAGRRAIRDAVAGFFASIRGLRHVVGDIWAVGDVAICRGSVTYTRHDGTTLTASFANVMELRGGAIARYQIYVDISKLYAAA